MFRDCEIADRPKVAHRKYMPRVGYKRPGYDGLLVEGNMMGYLARVSSRVQNKAADIRARVYRRDGHTKKIEYTGSRDGVWLRSISSVNRYGHCIFLECILELWLRTSERARSFGANNRVKGIYDDSADHRQDMRLTRHDMTRHDIDIVRVTNIIFFADVITDEPLCALAVRCNFVGAVVA